MTQRETVPDAVVRAADQIELIDMTPEALRRRMAHGHIYAAEKVDAALGHYFRVGNLAALRELALLWVADRVDEGLQDYRERHGLTEPWETRERVVVALTGAPGGERLIRRGARLAARSHAELVGVHVLNADGLAGPDQELLEHRRELLEELGGRFVEITGGDVADALVRFAVSENATQLLMGSSQQSRWAELTRGSVINRVIKAAAGGPIDVHVISASPSDEECRRPRREAGASVGLLSVRLRRPPPGLRSHRSNVLAWAAGVLGVPLVAVGLLPLQDAVGVPGMLLLLLLAPIGVALLGGMRPALVASVLAFLLADWFYFAPDQQPAPVAGPRRSGPGGVRGRGGPGQRPGRPAGPPQRRAGPGTGGGGDPGRPRVGGRPPRPRGPAPPGPGAGRGPAHRGCRRPGADRRGMADGGVGRRAGSGDARAARPTRPS